MTLVEAAGVFLPILTVVVGVVTAHFMGIEKAISASRLYTDKRVDSFIINTSARFDKIDEKIDKIFHEFVSVKNSHS